jgi:hypothetical protein
MSMLGSPNLHRGNVSLATRLRIHDLQAQVAPIDRYGLGDMSFALTGALRITVRSALRGVLSCGRVNGPDVEAV